jgi:CRP-like cAMP-binding protein
MAEILLRLAKSASDSEDQLSLRISREDLASMAGMATETVSRTLSDFKDEAIIEKKGSVIQILNQSKLQKMKN